MYKMLFSKHKNSKKEILWGNAGIEPATSRNFAPTG